MTLTTVGYGDVLPAHAVARSLAMLEAVVGPLYLAILISRLVSLRAVPGPARVWARAVTRYDPAAHCEEDRMNTDGRRHSSFAGASAALRSADRLPAPPVAGQTVKEKLDLTRESVESQRRVLVSGALPLTDAEAKAFWPLYDGYEKERRRLDERANKLVADFLGAAAGLERLAGPGDDRGGPEDRRGAGAPAQRLVRPDGEGDRTSQAGAPLPDREQARLRRPGGHRPADSPHAVIAATSRHARLLPIRQR